MLTQQQQEKLEKISRLAFELSSELFKGKTDYEQGFTRILESLWHITDSLIAIDESQPF